MSDLILLDIDGTLFDPELFGELIRAGFINILGVVEEELIRANADYYAALELGSDFSPRGMVSHMADRFKADPASLDRVFFGDNQIYKKCLYPEIVDTLKKLSSTKTLGIFSQGNEELQNRKLDACGIMKYFKGEHIFVHTRKLSDESIALLPRDAMVVDDNHEVAQKIAPFVESVWINRRTEDDDPEIRTIHLLSDLIAS